MMDVHTFNFIYNGRKYVEEIENVIKADEFVSLEEMKALF